MSSAIYEKLCERLNRFESKVPPVPSFFSLLAEIYTEKDAEMAVAFPDGSLPLDQLAKTVNRDPSEIFPLIETMADKGLVFSFKDESGQMIYELAPWMPGVIEFSVIRRIGTPKLQTIIDLSEKMAEEAEALTQGLMNDITALKEMLSDPHIRTLPIGEALPDQREIYPYENLLEMIENQTSFAAMKCCCRETANLRGEPCRIENIPEFSCLNFGRVADYVVDRKFGKRITKDECKETLKSCSDAGLVHNTNNFIEGMQFICNCCGCCCAFIQQVKTAGNLNVINTSNYVAIVDKDSCIGCGDCTDRCPVQAIRLENDIAEVDAEVCIGCGNCVTICPVKSLSMLRVSDKQPEIGDKRIGLGF